eukprot:8799229-Pyramimonas_sp.AAC.1
MWLDATRAVNTQRGCLMFCYAKEHHATMFNELTKAHLSSEDSGQVLVKHIKTALVVHQDCRLTNMF